MLYILNVLNIVLNALLQLLIFKNNNLKKPDKFSELEAIYTFI